MSFIPQPLTQALSWHYLCGQARLSLSADDFDLGELTPCAAEAAVMLDLAGELLDGLVAAGLVAGADWQWVAQSGALSAGGAQASWRGAEVQARLSLPWATLRMLDAAPEVPGLQWQPAAAECLLAQWRLHDDELAALEPGGLLLLEETAGRELRARSEATAGEHPWQLVARWEQPLAVATLMGWGAPPPALPPQCRLIDASRPDITRALGRLIPWGSGQAFRIDAV
ncbi:hypothetical protein J2X20_003583 [Pelomonas saccharophila]|uniref:Uncharacterized protein n=1 Tax=Roseateles saccharophilus TaxID=304 RepID=A0ABU1YPY2_ROSSA|nr:hypothetical protein [Roseateles saccharophilus]MDR7270925.1 hypothetical protein [Roseateles saccharophilus]